MRRFFMLLPALLAASTLSCGGGEAAGPDDPGPPRMTIPASDRPNVVHAVEDARLRIVPGLSGASALSTSLTALAAAVGSSSADIDGAVADARRALASYTGGDGAAFDLDALRLLLDRIDDLSVPVASN